MSNYALKSGNNLLKSGNYILMSTGMPQPTFDINPANFNLANNAPVPTLFGGNGLSFNQFDAAKQGVFLTNQLNGKPAVRFDGINDLYAALTAVNIRTAFIVLRALTLNKSQSTIFSGGYGTGGYFLGDESGKWFNSGYAGTFGWPAYKNRLFVNGFPANPISGALRQNFYVLLTLDVTDPAENININCIGGILNQNPDETTLHMDLVRFIGYENRMTEINRIARNQEILTNYNL